ncbi:hypothetical protein Psed_4390 [Pseudonocardia dioxanivorans CB1190]|uniref:Uncharacterized protein n=1 Tax=Pseudonocardia dioxanivorans (strain ATCC 55486 / DSM 44775 / JCM 13855 / CB1190) TaxID=675635 RepID=F4CXH3_PSEUX|nr:hypothetical protein [Pseudonocardia dioxanivorans]AEA26547.1 hypothetical protein Psed_4390 [Pseudonocardia dioxanivorans CB1190]
MLSRLAQARADRGWKKARLLHELRAAAGRRGETLPKDESLGRRVAIWENQGGAVGGFYSDLLCEVYGRSAIELGLTEPVLPRSPDPVVPDEGTMPHFSRLDASLVGLLRGQTQNIRLLDRRLGGAAIFRQARAHVDNVEQIVRYALPGDIRDEAAAELSQAAALAGWQALDMGNLDEAWRLHETAVSAARESGDGSALAYARAQQAYVLLDGDRPADAQALIASAGRSHAPIPPSLRAWLYAAEGEASAALGDRDAAIRALDAADALLPDQVDASLPYLMLDDGHLARWRGHCLARLGEESAIAELSAALAKMGEGNYGRAEVSLRVDLALAFTARSDIAEARKQAQLASELAGQTGSARQRRRIAGLLGL